MQSEIRVRVPATTANLGPGFDCLALALDLWNEAVFTPVEAGISLQVEGEGAGKLPDDRSNLVVRAAQFVSDRLGQPLPGLKIHCINRIPLSSGLGSSAAAVLLGLLGANALFGSRLDRGDLMEMAIELEGHPDNAAGALYGGLTIVVGQPYRASQSPCPPGTPDSGEDWVVRRFDLPLLHAALALPELDFPTHAARAVLPDQVTLADAVFNLGRTALVVEALRVGDLALLGQVMADRLHQPYRLPLIPGASEALAAACRAGAAAAAISGAGPSLIAFSEGDPAPAAAAMARVFAEFGLKTRTFLLQSTNQCAEAGYSKICSYN